jgi:hypothetical protein
VGQHPDPLEQAQHRSFYQKLLDEAKSTIESEYLVENDEKTERTFADHIVEFAKRHWKWVSGAGAVASFVSEFAKPLAEFTGLLAGGSAVGLVAALVMARKAKSETTNRACVSAAVVCGVFGLSSMTMLSVRAIYPDAQANGAVAKIVPGVEGLQQQVLGLDKKLGQIEQNTAETARNTGRIVETTTNTAQNTQQVAAVVETLKRETSDDPAKELANIGITPLNYRDAFIQGMIRNDSRLLGLIEKTGYQMSIDDYIAFLQPPYFQFIGRTEIRNRLFSHRETFSSAVCDLNRISTLAFMHAESKLALDRIIIMIDNYGKDTIKELCSRYPDIVEQAKNIQIKQWIADCAMVIGNMQQIERGFQCNFNRANTRIAHTNVSAMLPVKFHEEIVKIQERLR